MAIHYPNTEIYFIKQCPIAGEEQVDFRGSGVDQVSWFLGAQYSEPSGGGAREYPNVAFMTSTNSVIRKDGVIQAARQFADFSEVNYVVFRNHMREVSEVGDHDTARPPHPSSQKWFFARVTNLEYVNPNCTNVFFEVDAWQTYQNEVVVTDALVEREHVPYTDDHISAHYMPEGLDAGEPVFHRLHEPEDITWHSIIVDSAHKISVNGNLCLSTVIVSVDDLQLQKEDKTDNFKIITVNGIPQVAFFYIFAHHAGGGPDPRAKADSIADLLKQAAKNDKLESLICAYNVPTVLLGADYDTHNNTGKKGDAIRPAEYDIDLLNSLNEQVGYTRIAVRCPLKEQFPEGVKNKKCYTSQFVTLDVTNGSNKHISIKPEFVQHAGDAMHIEFDVCGSAAPDGDIAIYPSADDYTHAGANTGVHRWNNNVGDLFMSGTTFSQSALKSDTYAAWTTQNGMQNNISAFTSGVTGATGIATLIASIVGTAANPLVGLGMAVAGGAGIWQSVNNEQVAEKLSDKPIGSMSSSVNRSAGNYPFCFILRRPTHDKIKQIDHYFSLYGYKIADFKHPNFDDFVNRRPRWNYVKLGTCPFYGAIPDVHMRAISQMFLSGVRLWKPQSVSDIEDGEVGFADKGLEYFDNEG